MKILYLTYINYEKKNSIGVRRKIEEQVDAMLKLGHDVVFTKIEKNTLKTNQNTTICEMGKKNLYIKKYKKELCGYIKKEGFTAIYIRYTVIDYFFIKFIKKMKKYGIEIYFEIPTYPYDKELGYIKRSVDKVFRKMIKKGDVKKILISSDSNIEKLYNNKVEFLDNCIQIEKFKVKKNSTDEIINLIGVSFIRKSNGYDRVIKGMKIYKEKKNGRKIKFHIVGDGSELNNLKQLVRELEIEEDVIFYGIKKEEELDRLYDIGDIAVGSLGDHRVGILRKSPLKVREYCARGIPFITSIIDPGLLKEKKFQIKIKADESAVDIEMITKKYEELKKQDIRIEMRKYCEQNFKWEKYYKNILE